MAQSNSITVKLCFALCFATCILGVFFCVLKSPRSIGHDYMSIAIDADQKGELHLAERAIKSSVASYPVSYEAWRAMANIMTQQGDDLLAHQAQMMAFQLKSKSIQKNPVYAMPAELRLSLLALDDGLLR